MRNSPDALESPSDDAEKWLLAIPTALLLPKNPQIFVDFLSTSAV
jgi:hypothetical protein